MRDHLYCGKRVDNGEWVQGYYVPYEDIKDNGKENCTYIVEKHNGEYFPFKEVIEESVGEYTGINDKHGQYIFEGNIIRFAEWERGDLCWVGEVFFASGMFQIRGNPNKECESPFVTQLSRIPGYRIEVIGNVYDNPILLEQENNND